MGKYVVVWGGGEGVGGLIVQQANIFPRTNSLRFDKKK
jgi:hypothetical protein